MNYVKFSQYQHKVAIVLFLISVVFGSSFHAEAQSHTQTSLVRRLKEKISMLKGNPNYLADTVYLNRVIDLGFFYADSYPDSALLIMPGLVTQSVAARYPLGQVNSKSVLGNAWSTKGDLKRSLGYYNEAYHLAQENNLNNALPGILANIALVYSNQGNYSVALKKFYAAMHLAEKSGDKFLIRNCLNNIGTVQFYQGNMKEAEMAYIKTLAFSKELADTPNVILSYNNIAEVNVEQGKIKQAIDNLLVAYKLAQNRNIPNVLASVSNTLGDCFFRLDSLKISEHYFQSALNLSIKNDNARAITKAEIGLANVNNKNGLFKSALTFGLDAIVRAKTMGQAQLQRDALEAVANVYENMGDGNNAILYFKQYKKYADSLVNIENAKASANLKADYEIAKKEDIFKRKTAEQRWWIFSAFAALFSTILIIIIIVRNKKKLHQTYHQLQEKTEIIEEQKTEVEKTLAELKETQKQLIQSEKMASLGELTAGIAHEIQNPLNFVNNFSELNKEMLEELKAERLKPEAERDDTLTDELINHFIENSEKINHHGKRADAIVRGMLQHSRMSTGTRESVDINALCDEYLRLSYHGLRAKDKNFNATLKTDFDTQIGKIFIVPQDIGRVLLNLYSNAFYAVNDKAKRFVAKLGDGSKNYLPTVSISTKKENDKLVILVADNGNGISSKVLDKIFQPFFTTKPTGEGTGLGLSLSYDSIKAHGGELKVQSSEGEGTEFKIYLPLS